MGTSTPCCHVPSGPRKSPPVILQAETAAVLGQLAFRCHRPVHRLMQAVEATRARHPTCEAARRCRKDLDDLLEALSRSAAQPWGVPMEQPVEVLRVLEETIRLIGRDSAIKRLRITLRPECTAVLAHVHPVGLALVTFHLASNARDATARTARPRLFIDVHSDGKQAAIEFQDNGKGLRPQDLRCAFAPLFSKGGKKGRRPGAGLTTCGELVRFMRGTIRMQSHPSRGTTVLVTFPAAPPPA